MPRETTKGIKVNISLAHLEDNSINNFIDPVLLYVHSYAESAMAIN